MFVNGSTLEIDGVRFEFGAQYGKQTDARFFLAKPDDLIHDYLDLVAGAEGNIVELGIFRGGSAALMALISQSKRIVVIDLCEPVVELDEFIAERGIADLLRPHYQIDQSDRAALARIMADDFGGEPLDLIIDDASHLLAPTRASFEELFPRLRPGGRYLIEDWDWEISFATGLLDPTASTDPTVGLDQVLAITDDGNRILSAIGMELLAANIAAPDVISRVTFDRSWIGIERGPADIDPAGFRLMDVHQGLSTLFLPDESQIPGRS